MHSNSKAQNLFQGIDVDMDGLYSIDHLCDPLKCLGNHCCSKYEVLVENNEMDRIIGYMPAAVRYAPGLGDGTFLENVFERDEEDDCFIVDTDEDGLCVFAYKDARNSVLCSLHSVANDLRIPHYRTKPRACVLWPLAISEEPPIQLSIADDAFDFPCNRKRPSLNNTLDPNIARIILDLFGPGFLNAIEEARQKC